MLGDGLRALVAFWGVLDQFDLLLAVGDLGGDAEMELIDFVKVAIDFN